LRETEVQQPKVTATLSCSRSCLAFSAKSGQLEAPSTTTGSIFLPPTPPLALISSKVKRRTSRSEVSLMAIVPLREWRTPTLTVSAARAVPNEAPSASAPTPSSLVNCFVIMMGLEVG
jgi:hypothetical protein